MIALGSDHAGFSLKNGIIDYLKLKNLEFEDFGCFDESSCHYPDFAFKACEAVVSKKCNRAILFCGTGLGMAIAANKINEIRAVCCQDEFLVKMSRLHNDANVLCLGGRTTGLELAKKMVKIFLEEEFEGGRHVLRIKKIEDLERQGFLT